MGLMNYNAPIHIARTIEYWFDENGNPLVDRPPYSPNLNPIENAWAELKDRIYKLYSDLKSFDGTKAQLKKQFYKAIGEAWESLDDDYFNLLI